MLKKILLNILLRVLFFKKVYIYFFKQTCVKIQLIIKHSDNYILVKQGDYYAIPSIDVDLQNQQSIEGACKQILIDSTSAKIHHNTKCKFYMLNFIRDFVDTKHETKLFVDNLYIKVDVSQFIKLKDLNNNAVALDSQELKLMQFKHKLNIFDYKILMQLNNINAKLVK